ncbi:MAG: HAD-IIIA family hydrolase [Candidatus Kapabacteria bacterium]|nr:HAD-IIIA family hydrolase [Candidatus Kapabacteria bacterium]
MNANKALFLDRDGVINQRIIDGYVRTPNEFIVVDEVIPLLRAARSLGYLLILVSNQQGVGKGLMTMDELDVVHLHMQEVLSECLGGRGLDEIYVCTDLASANSLRRKPAPGMLLEAIRNNDLLPHKCWFLGDSLTDVQAGRSAGVGTALVGPFPKGSADIVVSDHNGLHALIDALQK